MKTIIKIETTFGGPCIYKRAMFSDGSRSGRVQYVGQTKGMLEKELRDYAENGKDDCMSFIDRVLAKH